MSITFSKFASADHKEGAFEVLAIAKRLIASGKDVIELEIGDSPFPSSSSAGPSAKEAIDAGMTRYAPAAGLPQLRDAAAEYINREYGFQVSSQNILVGPGAKNFQQLSLELFVNPGDGVLVFTPHFPTYVANIARRGARMVTSTLEQSDQFRPNLDDVRDFVSSDPAPKAIILNTPHNPTGGVATEQDLIELADIIRGRDIGVFSDEPYDTMVWGNKHVPFATIDGMLEQSVTAYTFSKSFSMSGWRIGFAVSSERNIASLATLSNTAFSCVSPFTQMAAVAALQNDLQERDRRMAELGVRLKNFVDELNTIDGIQCLMPGGSFYVFPSVHEICQRLNMTSQGIAMYLLQAADDRQGVACLGGECFGPNGSGFLRFTVTEPPERLTQAVKFVKQAITHTDRVESFLQQNPQYRCSPKDVSTEGK